LYRSARCVDMSDWSRVDFASIAAAATDEDRRSRFFGSPFFIDSLEDKAVQSSSVLSGFRNLSVEERLELLVRRGELTEQDVSQITASQEAVRVAAATVENVIGVTHLPLGIATNFIVDGKPVLVPMAVEEPSVIAAASNGAKFARDGGGIFTECDDPVMIGQVEIRGVRDVEAARKRIEEEKPLLLAQIDQIHPRLKARGGGARDLEFRVLDAEAGHVVVHILLDCRDAMGANLINTACEEMSGPLAKLTGGKAGLKILSNLADRRCVSSRVRIPVSSFVTRNFTGDQVAEGIVAASELAEKDPYRAATHNKGIMNGIDAVIIACGNDWRGVEAGAHAYACRDGRYRPLATWRIEEREDGRFVVGRLRLPMAVGIVGGGVSVNRVAQMCLRLMKVEKATDLARIAAAVGLAQNLAAVRALASEGIQKGHMSLHARSIALTLGARGDELEHVVRDVVQGGEITTVAVQRSLNQLRGPDGGLTRAINKAVALAIDTQDASGKWSGSSSPRIFETAIVLVALDRSGEHDRAVQKARLWLRGQPIQNHHRVAEIYEQMAYSLAMERYGAIDLSDPLLFDPIYLRKSEILAALATSLGRNLTCWMPKERILAQVRDLTETEEKRRAWKPWALSDLLAVRVLLGDVGAVEMLQKLQWEDGSVWNNPVSTAVAFLAFLEANYLLEARQAARYLTRAQSEEGCWSYVNLDVWATSATIRAFVENGEFQSQCLAQGLDYLLRQQNPDGGWGYASGIISDNESTSHALLALHDARKSGLSKEDDERVREAISAGLRFLKGSQDAAGLWTTWQSAGDAVVPEVLGHIAEAVSRCEASHAIDLNPCIQWMSAHQDLDGGWLGGLCRNFPFVQSSLLRGLPSDSPAAIKGRAALVSAVNSDGGWGITPGTPSCASATGLAIAELCRGNPERHRGIIREGVSFLLDRQKADGSWDGKPEMYGPRPLLFYLRPISHAFAASGLIAARSAGIHP
jgi:hydroxymethylglutaryl-CoA reductase